MHRLIFTSRKAARARLLLVAFISMLWTSHAQAGLIATLSEAGNNGVQFSLQGNGIAAGSIGGLFSAFNVGRFLQPTTTFIPRAFRLSNTNFGGVSISGIVIDRDFFSSDDFFFDNKEFLRRGFDLSSISGSSIVTGLSFSDLVVGTFSGSRSNDVYDAGGFSLNVVRAPTIAVPEPGALALTGLGLFALAIVRSLSRRKRANLLAAT